jgi:hypothetical protein
MLDRTVIELVIEVEDLARKLVEHRLPQVTRMSAHERLIEQALAAYRSAQIEARRLQKTLAGDTAGFRSLLRRIKRRLLALLRILYAFFTPPRIIMLQRPWFCLHGERPPRFATVAMSSCC